MRASGIGFVIGVGRLGEAMVPLIAGFLFRRGLVPEIVSLMMAVPAIAAALLLLMFRVRMPAMS